MQRKGGAKRVRGPRGSWGVVTTPTITPQLKYVVQLAIVCAAYFGSAKAGLQFAFANQSVTSVWPPTGLALAAILIWGYRMWPAIMVGAFLANITTAGSVLSDLGIATGNTLEAVIGVLLLHRVADFDPSLQRVRDVFALVICAAVVSTMVSATIGVASLSAAGLVPDGELASTWRVWWLGDAGGDVIVAPALLILFSRPRPRGLSWAHLDATLLLGVLVGVSVIAFTAEETLTYIVFPVLVWIAFRLRQEGTAIAGLVVSGIAIWFTSRGEGPFVGGSSDAELLRAQTFVGVATITGLLAAALATERGRAVERLRHLADHDQMTDLLNSRRFKEELQRWIAHNTRYGVQGSVLVLDVDRFKDVNDSLGHAAGDELLADIGRVLRERLRETDVVARLGGDEFTVLLPQASEEQARTVATELLDEVGRDRTMVDGKRGRVTVSIGATLFGFGIDGTPEQVLACADRAMYEAKGAGRNRVRFRAGADAEEPRGPTTRVRGSRSARLRLAIGADRHEGEYEPPDESR
jgi:diguanylate cyclase (GGDEF)-like protein